MSDADFENTYVGINGINKILIEPSKAEIMVKHLIRNEHILSVTCRDTLYKETLTQLKKDEIAWKFGEVDSVIRHKHNSSVYIHILFKKN